MPSIDVRPTEIIAPRDSAPEPVLRRGDSKERFADVLSATSEHHDDLDSDDVSLAGEQNHIKKSVEQASRGPAKPSTACKKEDDGSRCANSDAADDDDDTSNATVGQTADHPSATPHGPPKPPASPDQVAASIQPITALSGSPMPAASKGACEPCHSTGTVQPVQTPSPNLSAPVETKANTAEGAMPANVPANDDGDDQPTAVAPTNVERKPTPAHRQTTTLPKVDSDALPPIVSSSILQALATATDDDAPQVPLPASVATVPTSPDPADDALVALLSASLREKPRAGTAPGMDNAAPAAIAVDAPLGSDSALDSIPSLKTEGPTRPLGALAAATGIAAQESAQQQTVTGTAQAMAGAQPQAVDKSAPKITDSDPVDTVKQHGAAERAPDTVGMADPSVRNSPSPTDLAAATARPGRASFHPIVIQVAAHIVQTVADGQDRINIRLSPADLGRIDVKLDFGPDGRVQAVFAADRAQTVDLLQRDARDLERALQDAGLRADSSSLTFNLRGEQRDGTQSFVALARESDGDEPQVEIAAVPAQAYVPSPSAGRLDIRV